MEAFNECLGYLLTNCRDNAIEELLSDKRYAERKQVRADLCSKLKTIISNEAQILLEECAEATVMLQGMEYNKVLLCGLALSAELRKRFDISTPEYKALVKEFL